LAGHNIFRIESSGSDASRPLIMLNQSVWGVSKIRMICVFALVWFAGWYVFIIH
jgi:hypothetical protein